jgi:serine/threonine protein kinase
VRPRVAEIAVDGVEVGARLGSGAYGEVFAGTLAMRAAVAVKRTHDVLAEYLVAATAREAALSRALNHPNVVRCYGAAVVPGRPVEMVMERGASTLEALLRHAGGALTFAERVEVCAGIVRGVSYLHSRELVHADLRPANVLLARSLRPLVADMGLTHHVTSVGPSVGGAVAGPYCAPERRNVPPGADPLRNRAAWDVFSCAALCMEVLTGRGCVDWATRPQLEAAWAEEMRALAPPQFEGLRAAVDAAHAVAPGDRPPLRALLSALTAARQCDAFRGCGPCRGIAVAPDGRVLLQ